MSSLPKKGTIIINPKTQRPVKVGSRTWLKLVRDGLVEGQYSDPKEIYIVQEGDDEDELINQFNQSLPPNQQAVRGRGKYANKIVKRHKQPSTTATSRYTVKKTARKIKNREVYEDLQEGGNFEEDLEALIMGELANINTAGSGSSKYDSFGRHNDEFDYAGGDAYNYSTNDEDEEDFTTDLNEGFDNGGEEVLVLQEQDEDEEVLVLQEQYEDSLIDDVGGVEQCVEDYDEEFDDDFSDGLFE